MGGIIKREEVERLQRAVIKAMAERSVIWAHGDQTVYHGRENFSLELNEDSYEGEIVSGELLGSRILVHRDNGKEGKIYFGYLMTEHGQLQLSRLTGEEMWKAAVK